MSRFFATIQAGGRRLLPRPLPHRSAALVVAVAFGVQLIPASGSAGESDRPNIVLIMADDIGYECFGCYGSEQYRTPNIDRLAREGIQFQHCYSQPLCTPSRVKLMTGLSNARNYAAFSILRQDQRTIGHHFQAAGYRTVVAGKWQLLGARHYNERFRQKGTWPKAAGFDRHCLWQVDELGGRYWKPLLRVDGANRQYGEDDFGPQVVTSYITSFMETNRDKPFFVYYPMILVHSPFVPSPDSENRKGKNRQRNFEDMVTYTDKLVGQIVDKVKKLGLEKKTLILFTGDNGTHKNIRSTLNGQEIRGGKGMTTDAGTRVPLVIRWPGVVTSGRRCNDLVDFSDFLPTLLGAAGAPLQAKTDGRSFLPQLRGDPSQPREWLYCYYCPRPERSKPQRFVRDQRWKLYGDGRFFDVEADPREKRPLADPPVESAAAKAKEKLARALKSMPATGQSLLKFGD